MTGALLVSAVVLVAPRGATPSEQVALGGSLPAPAGWEGAAFPAPRPRVERSRLAAPPPAGAWQAPRAGVPGVASRPPAAPRPEAATPGSPRDPPAPAC
jgi:hypothetical protein